MSNALYPIAVNLRGRQCVVVGGGPVGTRKALALLQSWASVTVIAGRFTPELRERERLWREVMIAKGEKERFILREELFRPAHLDGAFLAIAATNNVEVNETVVRAARERGVLVNRAGESAPDTDYGDFVTMASFVRDDLLIATTTGGASPALAARVRRELEKKFSVEWTLYVSALRGLRAKARKEITDAAARTEVLRRLANSDALFEKIVAGQIQEAWEEAISCL